MKVVVLGAAGWTGRAVLANLAGRHTVRAFVRNARSWDAYADLDGDWAGGEIVHGDMADYHAVDRAMEGVDGAIHVAVCFDNENPNDDTPFLANVKGMWNVLETARRRGVSRVVHVGSCQTVHPRGVFLSADVRRPDATRYAVCKRLQEEMCRQFHEAFGMSVVVLRADSIVDARLGITHTRRPLGPAGSPYRPGLVCRHDFAEACRLALERPGLGLEILHIVGTPEAEQTCNVTRGREVLGLTYRADLQQYRG